MVPEIEEQVPQGQGVLAPGHGHQDPLAGRDHVVLVDGPFDLLAAVVEETVGAEAGVVPAHLDDGGLAADPALHVAPPEMTGRTSTVEPSGTVASPVTKVPSTMTRTASRL